MTDLKPSTEAAVRDPNDPSEASAAATKSPAAIKPAQARVAHSAPTKPSPATNGAASPLKPAQPRAVQPLPVKPGQPRPVQAAPIKPGQPRPVQAAPIKPAQPRQAPDAPTKPGTPPTSPESTAPIKAAQRNANQTATPTKPNASPDAKAVVTTESNLASAETGPAASNVGPENPRPTTKPAQPSAAETAASAKPGPASTVAAAASKTGPTVSQPAPSTKLPKPRKRRLRSRRSVVASPTQKPGLATAEPPVPSEAAQVGSTQAPTQTKHQPVASARPDAPAGPAPAALAAPTQPEPADTQNAEALIRAAMAQSTVPTKPGSAETAALPEPTIERATSAPATAPSEPSPSSAPAALQTEPSPAKTGPAAKPSKSVRVLGVALASVAATLVAVLAVAALFVNQVERSLTENLDRDDLMPTDTAPHPTKEHVAGDALNVAVMGYDSRNPSVERSGSLMILHLNAERDQAYFITFPRDSWVSIPGHGNNRINAAYGLGGTKLTVSTLEKLTDTRIDHAAMVNFQGFAKLTDAVGGVTVYNRTPFFSHGFHYPKGNITVSGERAIYFAGASRGLPRGDFDRAANERNLVRAIMAKTLSSKTISDPRRLLSVVSGTAEHLTVDKGLTDSKIRTTVLSLRLNNKDVHLMKAPVSSKATRKGQRVDVLDKAKLAELRTALREDKVDDYLAKYPQG